MCKKVTTSLVRKTYSNLAQFQFTIVIVVIPVRFGFTLSADMGIDLVYTICPSHLTLNVGVEPWFTLSVQAQAGITILVAHGGVEVTASFNYRLKPSVGTANCNICAILAQEIKPIAIKVSAYADAVIKKWDWTIYEWNGPQINNELFRKCLTNGKYEPYDPDNPSSTPDAPQQQTDGGQPNAPTDGSQPPPQTNQPDTPINYGSTDGSGVNIGVNGQQAIPGQPMQYNPNGSPQYQSQFVQQSYADLNAQRQMVMQEYYALMNYRNQLADWARRKECGGNC